MQISTGWCARLAVACMSAALVAGGGASTASANIALTGLEGSDESRSAAFDPNIVAARRALSPVEVRSHEITGSAAASAALTRAESAGDLGPTEGLRIYRFGEQEVMSPSHVLFTAFEGRTAAGSLVYEFAIHAEPAIRTSDRRLRCPAKEEVALQQRRLLHRDGGIVASAYLVDDHQGRQLAGMPYVCEA